MMNIVEIGDTELHRKGGIHTAGEIQQQPEVWSAVFSLIKQKEPELRYFLETTLKNVDIIILTGAGTSAFIGMSLETDFQKQWGIPTRAVATTDLVTHPKNYLNKEEKILLVSFARSGNSPESCGAVELADEQAAGVVHLIITCDSSGKLARTCRTAKCYTVVLPEETNDRSLAMTSSYTGMMLAGLLISRILSLDAETDSVKRLIDYGNRILKEYSKPLREVAGKDFNRAVFLGSGPQLGTATESHLKLQELTDGYVVSKMDSFLGFRHGPKAVTNNKTLVVYLFSNVPYVLKYESDLVGAMKRGRNAMYHIGIFESNEVMQCIEGHVDLKIILSDMSDKPYQLDEVYLAICNVLPAQLLGLFKSLDLDLRPDNPSDSGAISRVVEGVKIYPHE